MNLRPAIVVTDLAGSDERPAAPSARRSGSAREARTSPCSLSARASGRRGRPSRPGRPTCCSTRSIGTSRRSAPSASSAWRRAEDALGAARSEIETLRKAMEKAREDRSGTRSVRHPDRPAGRRPAGPRPGEGAGDRLRDEPGRGGAVRHRAPGRPEQPARPRPRQLRPPAGRPEAGRRPPVRGSAARDQCRSLDVDGGADRGRAVRGAASPESPGWHEARAIVRLLLDRVSGRYFAMDEEIVLSASVGVAMAPADGLTVRSAHAEGGAGRVRGGGERGRHPLLRPVHAPGHPAQPRHHAAARGRAQPRRAGRPLPAPGGGPGLADHRRRGAAALGIARAGHHPARRIRPPGRGAGPHGAHRDLGAEDGLRAGALLDRPRPARRRASRSTSRCASSSAATSPRWSPTACRRRASKPRSWSWS